MTFTSAKLPFTWPPSIPVIIPHRLYHKLCSRLRSNRSPASSLVSLQTSFSLTDTLRSLRTHRWSFYDVQYLILLILGIFSLCIIEKSGPIFKTFDINHLPHSSEHKAVLLDVLAWFLYGITHFGAPVVCSAFLFVFSVPGTLPVFSKVLDI
jgi:hypothetical protein